MNAETPDEQPPMSTPEAVSYARAATRLGKAAAIDPAMCLSYGAVRGQDMEIYEPAIGKNLPVVVFFHGGAWTHGGLEWLRFMAPAVTALPAVFVAATYRLAPKHRWPAAFDDVCSALHTVYELAGPRGYDRGRIVVAGHSAGGHLAALATLRGGFPWIRSCFPVSSRFDLHTANPSPGSGEERVYKMVLAHPAQDVDASPIRFIDNNRVPFHILWGENDFPRVSSSSHAMVDALAAQGVRVSSAIVPGAGHFDTHLQLADPGNAWYARLKQELEPC